MKAQPAEAIRTIRRTSSRMRGVLPWLGPAFIAAIAYVDPGNFATNIQGGARFGYLLVWVIVLSNLMAMQVQALSAKLGIATSKNLAEVCRDHTSTPVRYGLWVIAEIAAMATDVAEFMGAALGLHLLFGMPMLLAVAVTGVASLFILSLERHGVRRFEAVLTVMIGIISLCYLVLLVWESPDWGQVGQSLVEPRFEGSESIVLAAGILGATVMPHAIYLHSSLVQHRSKPYKPEQRVRLFKLEVVDILIAMTIAGLVNVSMLVMAATTFYDKGLREVAAIDEAYRTLEPLLGRGASVIFGIALLASGLASASVGTMAGQTVMQGFLHYEIPVWVRRLVTMAPSFAVVLLGWNITQTLVWSQVILSFAIPFALIPLVKFTADRTVMGPYLVNKRLTTVCAGVISALILALNVFLIWDAFM